MSSKGRTGIRAAFVGAGIILLGTTSVVSAGSPTPQKKAGDPAVGLTKSQLARFEEGKVRYNEVLAIEDGLGPIFNKSACGGCHAVPTGGWGTITVTRFGYADKGTFDPLTEFGGTLLQVSFNEPSCQEFVFEGANVITERLTNASLAFGMVEAIPDAQLLANADPEDLNADGISGVARMVTSLEDPKADPRVGRFGWKAQLASVLSFSGDASLMEMGLTNRLVGEENAPNGDAELLKLCDDVADPEDGPDNEGFDFIDRVTDFQRFLGQPPQTPKSGMTGEALFNQVGCNQCHVPQFTTSTDRTLELALRGKTIRVYSDFLLHDMGLLGDGIPDGIATDRELRTPTLWSLRTRDPMLHDGRAAGGTFFDRIAGSGGAVWWHDVFGSEAEASAEEFFALLPTEQQQVVDFLDSLGRIEYDFDGNNVVNLADLNVYKGCYGDTGVLPDDECAIGDIDQNGIIDLVDLTAFLTVYTGPNGDCDTDGQSDAFEIVTGAAVDKDNNGVPDLCELCPADLNGDNIVDGADYGMLLAAWGACKGCLADMNGDGTVDGADLGNLLSQWGSCP